MSEKNQLKPCPFCGLEMQSCGPAGDELAYWCRNCGAQGPNDVNRKMAAKMWNMRRPEDALRVELAAANERAERAEVALRDLYDLASKNHEYLHEWTCRTSYGKGDKCDCGAWETIDAAKSALEGGEG